MAWILGTFMKTIDEDGMTSIGKASINRRQSTYMPMWQGSFELYKLAPSSSLMLVNQELCLQGVWLHFDVYLSKLAERQHRRRPSPSRAPSKEP